MRFAFKHDKSRKLECIMSCTAWVTRGTAKKKEFRIRKQVSFLYKATADVKIALGIKVLVKKFTNVFFAYGVRSLTKQIGKS